MMEAKHTPRPWRVVCEGGGLTWAILAEDAPTARVQRIATVHQLSGDAAHGSTIANALLIAAAPDLAEALLRMFTDWKAGGPGFGVLQRAEDVLRKAGVRP
jgi:hypothetical protein